MLMNLAQLARPQRLFPFYNSSLYKTQEKQHDVARPAAEFKRELILRLGRFKLL